MVVRNIGAKVIGFGQLVVLPGDIQELPPGYSEKHPVVRFYLEKKFIEAVASVPAPHPAANTGVTVKEYAAASEAVTEASEAIQVPDAAETSTEAPKKVKSINSMTLDELRAYAAELGISIDSKDTKAVLKEKITTKLQAE